MLVVSENNDTVSAPALQSEDTNSWTPGVSVQASQKALAGWGVLPAISSAAWELQSNTLDMPSLVPYENLLAFLRSVYVWKDQGCRWLPSKGAIDETSSVGNPSVHVQSAIERLEGFRALGEDWDSYDAEPPSLRAITLARVILESVCENYELIAGERVRPYAISPLSDGGVQVEWRGPQAHLELEINTIGQISYLLVTGTGEQRKYEEAERVPWSQVMGLIAGVLID